MTDRAPLGDWQPRGGFDVSERFFESAGESWDEQPTDTVHVSLPEAPPPNAARPVVSRLDVMTWAEFRTAASATVRCLIDGLWPEAAFGFLAGPPKAGKTWVALAMALCVVGGLPVFGRFRVPRSRPVLYVALEGHAAALSARVGCLARGIGLDPDSGDLDGLSLAYKPRGIDLSDPAWAADLTARARELEAGAVFIDVLRRAAVLRENVAEDFMRLESKRGTQRLSTDLSRPTSARGLEVTNQPKVLGAHRHGLLGVKDRSSSSPARTIPTCDSGTSFHAPGRSPSGSETTSRDSLPSRASSSLSGYKAFSVSTRVLK